MNQARYPAVHWLCPKYRLYPRWLCLPFSSLRGGIRVEVQYDKDAIEINRLPIAGVRIDRVHGNSYRVAPRYYVVRDRNLRVRGTWVIELHTKQVEECKGAVHEATVVKVELPPIDRTLF